jgi:hypothetical protein
MIDSYSQSLTMRLRVRNSENSRLRDVGDNVLYHSLLGWASPQHVLGVSEMLLYCASEATTFVNTCRLPRTNPRRGSWILPVKPTIRELSRVVAPTEWPKLLEAAAVSLDLAVALALAHPFGQRHGFGPRVNDLDCQGPSHEGTRTSDPRLEGC